jgi:hypothetical protein
MTLTRSFKETVMARIERDAEFREALLREGIECLISDDVDNPAKASDTAASPLTPPCSATQDKTSPDDSR